MVGAGKSQGEDFAKKVPDNYVGGGGDWEEVHLLYGHQLQATAGHYLSM